MGSILFKDYFLKRYKKDFKREFRDENEEILKRCESYIDDYFTDFDKKVNDDSIRTLLSYDEGKTRIFRIKYGVGKDGIRQTNEYVADVVNINPSKVTTIVEDFYKRLFIDLTRKLRYIVSQLRCGNEDIKIEELIGVIDLNLRLNVLSSIIKYCNAYVVCEFNCMTTSELRAIYMLGEDGFNELVCKLRDNGCIFKDEEELEEKITQNQCKVELIDENINLEGVKEKYQEAIRKIRSLERSLIELSAEGQEDDITIDLLNDLIKSMDALNSKVDLLSCYSTNGLH